MLDVDPATDNWMILACDGIWNFMSSQEVVDYVNKRIDKVPEDKLSGICEEVGWWRWLRRMWWWVWVVV